MVLLGYNFHTFFSTNMLYISMFLEKKTYCTINKKFFFLCIYIFIKIIY